MKHVPQDKYNVAWFTLAECVARGEKVRALGVYRLLSYSIEDTAFRRQLEGDILLAFQDKDDAIVKYKDAASLYQKSGKQREAVAVYEHLMNLEPEKYEYLSILIELYTQLNINSKVVANLKQLFEVQLHRHDFKAAEQTLALLDNLIDVSQICCQHEQITFALMQQDCRDQEKILLHIKAAVDGFLQSDDNRALQKFLSTLEGLNPSYAIEACRFAQDDQKA